MPVEPPAPGRRETGDAATEQREVWASRPGGEGGAGWAPLLASYESRAGHFDELRDERRALRPAWQSFARHASGLTASRLSGRQTRIARQIHENGVTYNVYGDPTRPRPPVGAGRAAADDPGREWEPLDARVRAARPAAERDRRRPLRPAGLLRDGLLPPGARLRPPGLPAPVPRRRAAGRRLLHLSPPTSRAAPDGRWSGDRRRARRRRRAPATRSRTASRVARCSGAFRELRVTRLAPFFRTLRDTLLDRARRPTEKPHVVLLTPGPVQRDLLRARVPGALPRLHAGRGRRPHGARQARLPEDAQRARARRRDPAAARRRLLRPAGAARRFALGVPGLRAGVARAARCWSPTRSAAACSNRRRCWRSCRRSCGACSAKSSQLPSVADLVVRRRGGARRASIATSRAGDQAGVPRPRASSRCSAPDARCARARRLDRAACEATARARTCCRSTCRSRTRRSGGRRACQPRRRCCASSWSPTAAATTA